MMQVWKKLTRREKKYIFIGLTVIVCVCIISFLLSNRRNEEAISLEEVCQSLQFYELDKQEWMEVLSDKVSGELTVADLKKILTILGVKDYIQINPEWKDKQLLSREDYYIVYEDILSLLDLEGRVKKQVINVTKRLDVTEKQGVICSDTFIFRVSYGFSDFIENQSYTIYSIGMEILGYLEVNDNVIKDETVLSDKNIRVLLSYAGVFEWSTEQIVLHVLGEYELYFNDTYIKDVSDTDIKVSDYMKNAELSIHYQLGNRIELVPKKEECRFTINFGDNTSNPYRGKICIYPKESSCFMVNEIPLEQYLYAVVPSEMPASYEPEALKVQAVCARSYAYQHLLNGGRMDYYAHVDDTTNYQVYNKTPEKESSNKAVDETCGMYLTYQGNIATTYYFSTSMGVTAGASYWGMDEENYGYLQGNSKYGQIDLAEETAFQTFINTPSEDDYEINCKYYRWSTTLVLDEEAILSRISERMQVNKNAASNIPQASWGEITGIYVKQRDISGGIRVLTLQYKENEIDIRGEYNIRYCLGKCATYIVLQNEEKISMQLLPSAFFYIQEYRDGKCVIMGGGYGHGIGMSQNGANGMAKEGHTFDEILEFYYKDCKLEQQ